jgi:glutamate dehydrogenase/leucine dehydrogenase
VALTDYPQWQLVAASDSRAGLVRKEGLSVAALAQYKADGKRFADYTGDAQKITNEELLEQDVDVLVLAALGDVITEENVHKVKAKYILELANGPVNDKAGETLAKAGITIVPDILANAGGVIVSYLEWLQNKNGEHWPEDQVNQELHKYLTKATKDILEASQNYQVSLKEAAMIQGLRTLTEEN